MRTIKAFTCLALLIAIVSCSTSRQSVPLSAQLTALLNSQNYTFFAQRINPANQADLDRVLSSMPGGSAANVYNIAGSNYTLRLHNDTLKAQLPYFGRSYNPPLNGNEQGISFSTTNFGTQRRTSHNSYIVTFTTRGLRENYTLTLQVFNGGSASLNVHSNSRQQISYTGRLAATTAAR